MTFYVHLMMLVASGDFGAHAFSATLSRQSHHGFGRSTLLHAGRSEKAIVSVPSDVSKRISFVSSLVTVNDADVDEVGDDNSDGIDDNDDDGDDDASPLVLLSPTPRPSCAHCCWPAMPSSLPACACARKPSTPSSGARRWTAF